MIPGFGRWLAGALAVLAAVLAAVSTVVLMAVAAAVVVLPVPMETPATAPGSLPPEGQRFSASDGAVLAMRSWQPAGPPRLILVAVHGMNDYSLSFDRPARLWASLGIATYALDQRGFGQSLARGRWYGGTRMADDTVEFARHLRASHPGVPLALLGESLGGAVAVLAAARAERGLFEGLALSAPAIWGDGWRSRMAFAGARLTGTLAGWITVPPLDPANASTDDPAVWQRLRSDPLVIHRTRFDTLAGIVALMADARDAAAAVRLPVLVMLGDLDRHVPRDGVAALLDRLPADTQLALYAGGRHLLLRSLNGDDVSREVAGWLTAPRTPLPSDAALRGRLCVGLLLRPDRSCPGDPGTSRP